MLPLLILLILSKNVTKACICVPFWECSDDYSSEDFFDYFDPRSKPSPCPGIFDTCCNIRCGQKKPSDVQKQRILNGNVANFAEFPWMLALFHKNIYKCGGSLIHPKVALTAGHCVQASGVYRIRAGEHNMNNDGEPLRHQDRIARKIIIHPKYNPHWLHNDIALIILDQPFQLGEHIGTVCLPVQNSFAENSECEATGWGKTSFQSVSHQKLMKKVTLPIIQVTKCVQILQETSLGRSFALHQSFICAGGGSKDTCEGDGGSPLVCAVNGNKMRFEQVGIVSWGLKCGRWETPGVYVNVALFVDWIDGEMKKRHLDSQTYKYQ